MQPIEPAYYPVTVVAAELDEGVKHLADRLGDSVLTDGGGVRVVARHVVRALIADKAARLEAEREHRERVAEQARAADTSRPARERVRAIARQQQGSDLQLDDLDLASAAHTVMTADHHEARTASRAEALDEMLRVGRDGSTLGVYHSVSPTKETQ